MSRNGKRAIKTVSRRSETGKATKPTKPAKTSALLTDKRALGLLDIPPTSQLRDTLDLLLDPENPRLSRHEKGKSQPQLIDTMLRNFKVEELAESILNSGFAPIDPILGVREPGAAFTTIVEGNRRITALQLLIEPSRAPASRRRRWEELSALLPQAARESIRQVSVREYTSRDHPELVAYVGYRHVTGPLKWPALEKASYIARLVEANWSFEKIADLLASTPRSIEHHYIAFRLASQAVDDGIEGAESVESLFGVLIRALQTPGIRDFLGIEFTGRARKGLRPVPATNSAELKEFIRWTFGIENKTPRIVTDSRDLSKWGEILSSSPAVGYLRRSPTPSFEHAWLRSGGEASTLTDTLLTAADRLQEAVPLVRAHREQESVISAVARVTGFTLQILEEFPQVADEQGVELPANSRSPKEGANRVEATAKATKKK